MCHHDGTVCQISKSINLIASYSHTALDQKEEFRNALVEAECTLYIVYNVRTADAESLRDCFQYYSTDSILVLNQ